jgi:hypothetical protein
MRDRPIYAPDARGNDLTRELAVVRIACIGVDAHHLAERQRSCSALACATVIEGQSR